MNRHMIIVILFCFAFTRLCNDSGAYNAKQTTTYGTDNGCHVTWAKGDVIISSNGNKTYVDRSECRCSF
jgi:hypothetical protein